MNTFVINNLSLESEYELALSLEQGLEFVCPFRGKERSNVIKV